MAVNFTFLEGDNFLCDHVKILQHVTYTGNWKDHENKSAAVRNGMYIRKKFKNDILYILHNERVSC